MQSGATSFHSPRFTMSPNHNERGPYKAEPAKDWNKILNRFKQQAYTPCRAANAKAKRRQQKAGRKASR